MSRRRSLPSQLTNWTRDPLRDAYTYTYDCGHSYTVTGIMMQRGGQVAPPLCPECHGQKVIDQMEADQWKENPKWGGFAPGITSGSLATTVVPSGPLAWLDYQITTTRQRAWR